MNYSLSPFSLRTVNKWQLATCVQLPETEYSELIELQSIVSFIVIRSNDGQ